MDLNARLLDALTDIEQHLHANYPQTGRGAEEFREAAGAAHREGRLDDRELRDLDDLRALRNLLSHSRWHGTTPVRASVAGVTRAEQLREKLMGKIPRVSSLTTHPPTVTTVTTRDTVERAVARMQEGDYSCLPVVNDATCVGLLSSHDLVCWLGARLTTDGEVFDIPVGEVMDGAGPDHLFVGRDLPQREARQAFIDHLAATGTPLSAILITMTGHSHEPLLGILTPWDLPTLTPS